MAVLKSSWALRSFDENQAETLSRDLGVSELFARLLSLRGVSDASSARQFLEPELKDLHDPFSMKGVDLAVERILDALKRDERIWVFGDYDVDGITSTSVLLLFLRRLGLDVSFYIPSRLDEGYGLSVEGVDKIADAGCQLLVTVDCGVSDIEPVARAVERGMEVIVIDHHQVGDELPKAVAILNPHQEFCAFPTQDLAAVGVVFNLILALRSRLREGGYFVDREEPNLREFLDLVALGTIADIVPLVGENRVIVRHGLEELTAGRRPGVAALKEVAGLFNAEVTVGQVAFRMAPRINAVGRLGMAELGVELMTTRSYSDALRLARKLDQSNSKRQDIERDIFTAALKQAEVERERGQKQALVLASQDWHVGVIGIVASRLVDRFKCPVVMIAMGEDSGRGSARSAQGVHLYEALHTCRELLDSYGGHRSAAGLSVSSENLEKFRKAFLNEVERQIENDAATYQMEVDAEVPPSSLTQEDVEKLAELSPHGLGNPEPVFLARHLIVRSSRLVGREEPLHLKLTLLDGDRQFGAIGFRMGHRKGDVTEEIDLLYTPEFNTWNGTTSIQLRIKDLRPSYRGDL
ncbi:MAG: single-stranded-DNA-specific exonuclease RecJ [Deltaproteobacteria bacterium]|nr:single-stranded-DNA-specific exonuclease RecJ [Deltaproteobacteria bacterium]